MGLYTIDLGDLSVTLQSSNSIFTSPSGAKGIAWNPIGSAMYIAKGKNLYKWNPGSPEVLNEISSISGGNFATNIEALGFIDGRLFASGGSKVYDVTFDSSGNYSATQLFDASGRDFMSMAGPVTTPILEPATMVLLGLGGIITLVRHTAHRCKKA